MRKLIAAGVLALLAISTPAVAQTTNNAVRVMNYSNSSPIVSVTVTNTHGNTYETLDGRTITPGYNRVLNLGDPERHGHCVYTIQARFANGTIARRQANTCQIVRWRIADLDNDVE